MMLFLRPSNIFKSKQLKGLKLNQLISPKYSPDQNLLLATVRDKHFSDEA